MSMSKSKYCEAVQCNKILWLDKYKIEERDETPNKSVLDNGTDVGILAKRLFGDYIDINFSENLIDMINDTKEALKNKSAIITEASFSYDNNFCSVDILKKIDDTYEIYEVKSSTEIKDIYIDDISYQVYVLLNLGLEVKKASIVYLNSEYERHGELKLNELFNIEDVTKLAFSKQNEIEKKLNEIKEYLKDNTEPSKNLGMHCVTPYDCPYFKYCTKHLPENNVFKIRGMRSSTKFNLYNENIYTYEALLNAKINIKYKEQIEFELYNKEPSIDKLAIKETLDKLTYPLYFLDFETYQQAIPEYDYVRPYMQIPFQYSLHYILSEKVNLMHKEFLGESDKDPRRALAESLVNDIPENVTTVAYNMMFEKMVIKNLASMYPDLSSHLMNIYNNMQDLMIPFKDRKYYTKDMHGSYSIKYVLPALFPNDPTLDYHNLDLIHNGSEAMTTFKELKNYTLEEQKNIRHNLLKYCELDTYAMVKIWQKLKDIVNEK